MRKEVKLGMALGSGLVALLVAYLVVAPPSDHKKGVQLALDESGSIIDPTAQSGEHAAAATPEDKTTGELHAQQSPTPAEQPAAAEAAKAAAPKGDDKAGSGAGDHWTMLDDGGKRGKQQPQRPVKVTQVSLPGTLAPQQPKEKDVVKPDAAKVTDEKVTDKHEAPKRAGVAEAQVAPESRPDARLYYSNPNDAYGGGLSIDGLKAAEHATRSPVTTPKTAGGTSAVKASSAEQGSTAPTVAGSTHVVRSGETFSSIAQAVYGSAAYYPHLIRANPHANPNNLKLGTVLTLPKVEDVKATGGNGAAAGGQRAAALLTVTDDVKIDPKTQYRVQSGDSLYKISSKVYGKPTFLEAIYEKNKQAIGSNPTKLKLGMILELPEPATGLASPAPLRTTSALGDGLSNGH